MTGYRLFLLERGHIRGAEELEAESDAEAIERAEALRAGRPAELWRRTVMVTAFAGAAEFTAARGRAEPSPPRP